MRYQSDKNEKNKSIDIKSTDGYSPHRRSAYIPHMTITPILPLRYAMKKFLISFVSVFMLISFLNAQDAAKKEEKPKTTKEYINDLGSTDENAIVKACDYLGQKEEKDAIPKLLPLLKDSGKSAQVRMWSAIALGLIGDEKTLDPLAESVQKDSSADVRYSAILAMSRIGVKDKKYLELFKDRMNGDPDPFIRDYLTKLYEKAGGK